MIAVIWRICTRESFTDAHIQSENDQTTFIACGGALTLSTKTDVNLIFVNLSFFLFFSSFLFNLASLQFVTIFTFFTMFLSGFIFLYSLLSCYFRELRTRYYNAGMSISNIVNGNLAEIKYFFLAKADYLRLNLL